MKRQRSWPRTVAVGLLLMPLLTPASAETWNRYQGRPGSKLKLEGTSSMHDWTVEGKIIGGFLELESNFSLDSVTKPPPSGKVNAKVEVQIPVTSLESPKNLMNDVMYEALKQKEHPQIKYRLIAISPKGNAPAGALQFDATGELTIAGVARTNSMLVTFEKVDPTRLKVKGEAAVKMKDFGVKVRAPLGLPLSVGDDVKITFEWLTSQKAAAAK